MAATVLQYHSVNPDSLKTAWYPSDIVVFSLNVGAGRALLSGSVYIEGSLAVLQNGIPLEFGDDVRLDPDIGTHALVAELTTEATNKGVVEQTGAAYSRYCRMVSDCTTRPEDKNNATAVASLQSCDELVTRALLRGYPVQPGGGTQHPTDPPTFSFAPIIAINRASGPLAFSKTGEVKLVLRLATVQETLFGGDVGINTNYSLSNLRCTFNSVPDSLAPATVVMRSFSSAESAIQSRTSNVTTKLPAVCDSISVSFIRTAHRSQYIYNSAETERITGLDECVLMINDTVNGRVAAPVDDEAELLRLYLESMNSSGSSSLTSQNLKALHRYGIGYPLGAFLDLSRVPFSLVITADSISNTTPYVVTIIGHSVQSI